MKIVVTGALGHIGSKLIRTLPGAFPGAEVVLLDNLLTQRYCSLFELPPTGRYDFRETDILGEDLDPLFDGARCVIHLAAITDAASSFDAPAEVERVNYEGTKRVAQSCQRLGVPLLFPSTTSVYGPQGDVVDEQCPPEELKPQSPYADSKLKAERYLQELGSEGLQFVACRFGTIFGVSPGMRFHTAINKFCWQAAMGQSVTVWRTALHQKRPYLDLADAVSCICFMIQRDLFTNGVMNVVTINHTVGEIVSVIRQEVPDLGIELLDSEIMNQLSYTVSNQRLRDEGFSFQGNLRNGITDTIRMICAARFPGAVSQSGFLPKG